MNLYRHATKFSLFLVSLVSVPLEHFNKSEENAAKK